MGLSKKSTEHSPDSIADTTSNFIEQRPGTHTTVVITQHVTDAIVWYLIVYWK